MDKSIKKLVDILKNKYGTENLTPYGTSSLEEENRDPEEDPHGIGFLIKGVQATFSVHTEEGILLDGVYNVQIESDPPGEELFTGILTLNELLLFIQRIRETGKISGR